MLEAFRNDPVKFTATGRALLQAIITLAVAFGLPITPAERDAILEVGAALVGVSVLFSAVAAPNVVPKAPTSSAGAIQTPPPGTVLVTQAAADAAKPVPASAVVASPAAPPSA